MNKVYGVPLSPYVRKVLFVLEHKNIEHEIETVMPFHTPDWFVEKSPLIKIPCFEDEYVTLPESSIICSYLNDKYPENSIYPKCHREKARALWFEKYADTRLAEVLLTYYFQNLVKPALMGGKPDEEAIKAVQQSKEPETLSYLESQVPSEGFLFSEGLMLADMSIAGLFVCGSYAKFELCSDTYPKLSAYVARVIATDDMQKRMQVEKKLLDSIAGK